MPDPTQKNIIDLIKRSQKILVLPSSPPDGDSLGSAIALYMSLRKLGKEITVISSDPVPEVFDFLPNIKIVGNKLMSSKDFIITIDCRKTRVDKVKSNIEDDKINIIITPENGQISEDDISFNKGRISYDLIITVDCAELTQLRVVYEENIELFNQIPVINVDHHVSNTHFGKINNVDIMASSTTELLLPLLEELSKAEEIDLIDEDIATLLLTGIITDTGSFQNANTTPRAFERASELIAYGARQQEIIQYIYKTKQLSQLKLWGRVLSKIQTDEKYRIVWSVASQQDFLDTGSTSEETGDIIDELMTNAPGAEIVLLMKEKKDGSISVSMRSTTPAVDVSKIAENFSGGGHTQASGFMLSDMPLRDAEYKVINAIKEYQAERLHFVEEDKKPVSVEERIEEKPAKEAVEPVEVPVIELPKPVTPKIKSPEPPAPQKAKKTKAKQDKNFEFKPPVVEESKEPEQKEEEPKVDSPYRFED